VALALYLISDFFFLGGIYRERERIESIVFGQMAQALQAASGGQGTVFLEPIGVIGYLCPLRVIDEVGLVSPEVPRRRAQGPGWYADIVHRRHPDFLVVRLANLKRNENFAGAQAPFRSPAERDAVLAEYADVTPIGNTESPDLSLLKRR
jgi:hypothetical protein